MKTDRRQMGQGQSQRPRRAGQWCPMPQFRVARMEHGFTLIEIMMVVVIIGILVAVVVPNVIGFDDSARKQAEVASLRGIGQALELYKLDNRQYPSTDQGLSALVEKPSGYPEAKNWGPEPYLRKYPLDQWDNEYVYVSSGRTYELRSLGADGEEGGEDANADISYSDV